MLSADAIVSLHDHWTDAWHHPHPESSTEPSHGPGVEFLHCVVEQHRTNFDLWHTEDEARRLGATDSEIAAVKRRIDHTNQHRNDLAEELDRILLDHLAGLDLPAPDAPLHSESPGLIIDRLSILSLKLFHTREQTERTDAPAGHAQRNQARLAILQEQRTDLAACLDTLWNDTLAGKRRFKLYRQLKMYNDPSLNPALYAPART